jgi:tetratricopeptide (TPR) repeat protein
VNTVTLNRIQITNVFFLMYRFFCYFLFVLLAGCDNTTDQQNKLHQSSDIIISDKAEYSGKESCVDCHQQQASQFASSHHDLAMQYANPDTVIGDFKNVEFHYNNIKTTFFKKGDRYFVNTDGSEGKLEDFEIKYTFGVEPLQQYLIEMSDGRLQALNIVWDSRSTEEGGQRWYHLYPEEQVSYQDTLHWTKNSHNWNFMCAECHSTNLEKNYDNETDSYSTTWSEIDVSCEACHGPASNHIKLTQSLTANELNKHADKGFEINFQNWSADDWLFKNKNPIASLKSERNSGKIIDNCGRCHSRRSSMHNKESYKTSIHDSYLVSMLEPGLYHADGQINDEVYVYGSFLQSKMYQNGVNCIDCHEPHSLKLRAEGNALCQQCHSEDTYNTESHHFHEINTEASQCVSCHMPTKNYMVIDPRRDHSFRVPRPDLTLKTGSPNACNQCHTDKAPEWAVSNIKQWYAKESFGFHYGEALHAVDVGAANAEVLLMKLLEDDAQPAIARASALQLIANFLNPNSFEIIHNATGSDDTLMKIASINALSSMAINDRHKLLKHLLEEKDKSVRINAARVLAPAINTKLSDKDKVMLMNAIEEYIDVQLLNGERAFSHANLGNLYTSMGEYKKAQASYETAIKKERTFVPAYANLADLYRQIGTEEESQSILFEALKINKSAAVIHHALGLSLVRQKKLELALQSFKRASTLEPDNSQFNLVYAIALNSNQKSEEALSVLKSFLERNPKNAQTLMTLSTLNRDKGNIKEALVYAEKLLNLVPDNIQVQNHVNSLNEQYESRKF